MQSLGSRLVVRSNWNRLPPTSLLQFSTKRNAAAAAATAPLANEELLSRMRRLRPNVDAGALDVRLVADPLARESKGGSSVVSLKEAVRLALDEEKDLVEVSLQQKVPVLTISKYKNLLYASQKAQKKKKTATKPPKEVVFSCGIAENDMNRKMQDLSKFLGKGFPVVVTIKGRRFQLRKDPDIVKKSVETVFNLVKDEGEVVKPPVTHPGSLFSKFQLRPKPTKK